MPKPENLDPGILGLAAFVPRSIDLVSIDLVPIDLASIDLAKSAPLSAPALAA
jgi:hypothetical protein